MDLLVEKLDGSRYYLSQYKVLITEFEESAPSVTRNNMQLDQRNGNIDFGGWHTDKTINITGYYRADDMDDEEALREKLYALLSEPDGYYITQLKTSPETAMERPGETSGNYYDKLKDYPSHKRFLVYTEAPEMELVGNINGTLLYKLTVEFKTIKLPYGETPAKDVTIDSPYKDLPVNLLVNSSAKTKDGFFKNFDKVENGYGEVTIKGTNAYVSRDLSYGFSIQPRDYKPGDKYTMSMDVMFTSWNFPAGTTITELFFGQRYLAPVYKRICSIDLPKDPSQMLNQWIRITQTSTIPSYPDPSVATQATFNTGIAGASEGSFTLRVRKPKQEFGSTASPWSPNPADPEFNSLYYGLSGNVSIPYSGTVPCNQLEQQFAIELTAMGGASSLSFKIDDTELTSTSTVAAGDVFMFSGFSYTKNGLSIVSKTNKAYFVLQPDKPNRITCNVPGVVRILGFQNLYA